MRKFNPLAGLAVLSLCAATSVLADGHAQGWTLEPTLSNVSFGSIKNDYTGESHTFTKISGAVSAEGMATVTLNLGSVETLIDIRNARMAEFVFRNAPEATITAEIDMSEVNGLAVGEATTLETYGTLALLGVENELDANLFVMRLSEDRVLVSTNGMVMLSTEDAQIDAGIDKLQELASLDSITRVSPVTLRLVFDAD
ncbi:YceI family protein [Sulfitobacter albidus]|uniref:YceI family protein n=1 Tax=Sulfitobacter albidus TaxID=2829501 RepID=A0A975JC98_9RHOB|nr:YceI family protein [Sulfitobacter albidus]QUJ75702.1 YceI family protein [Sulfitobacter albidus]